MNDSLTGDPARSAEEAIAGFDYQLWWSLHAWCTLPKGSNLYLERAEDFDIESDRQVQTVQVKSSGRRLTLGSKDALAAIAHWWEHRERNPGYKVLLRFLTRAEVGVERGQPFGRIPGVEYWQRASRLGTDVQPLRQFLHARADLPEGLRVFIGNASEDALREDLIRRISWDTGGASRQNVRELVERSLIERCAEPPWNLTPEPARRLVPGLYQRVVDAVLDKKLQPLTFASLQERIEEDTTERRPRHELRTLEHLAFSTRALLDTPSPMVISGSPIGELEPLPTAAIPGFIPRAELVSRLAALLAVRGVLVLRGSSGMGKSHLAILVASRASGTWFRLNLRGHSAIAVRLSVDRAVGVLQPLEEIAGVVIDDLNVERDGDVYEISLLRLLDLCRARSWNVVITTRSDLSSRILAALDPPPDTTVTAPPFSSGEITLLAEMHGCPPGDQAARWAKVVETTTSGHPQLAHARVRRLREASWPSSDEAIVEFLKSTEDLTQTKADARKQLQADLPSSDARALVYRLSAFSSYFSREQAISVAGIPNPGEVLDSLCGPWIEGPTEGYYRLSPLLKGSAEEVLGAAEVRKTRAAICDAIVASRSVSPTDFAELLLQALVGRYERGLAAAAFTGLQVPPAHEATAFGALAWFPLMQLETGKRLSTSCRLSLLLRLLQFRVAVSTKSGSAPEVMDAFDHEFAAISDEGDAEQARKLRFMFLFRALSARECLLAPRRAAPYAAELLELARADSELHAIASKAGNGAERGSLASAVVEGLISRARGSTKVSEFLTAIGELRASASEELLAELRRDAGHTANMMMSLFDSPPPNSPEGVEGAVASAIQLGERHDLPALVAAAYRARAVLEHEYHRDSRAALAILDDGRAALRQQQPAIDDYRATVLAETGREPEALGIWRELLHSWEGGHWIRAYSARLAGMAACRLRRYSEAAEFFGLGAQLARELGLPTFAAGLLGDRGVALWREGERAAAIDSFRVVLAAFDELPEMGSNTATLVLWKLTGAAVLWALSAAAGPGFFPERIPEPGAGRLSEPNISKATREAIRELPVPEAEYVWSLLATVDIETNAGVGVEDELAGRWPTLSSSSRFHIADAKARRALRLSATNMLVELAATLFDVLAARSAERNQSPAATPTGSQAAAANRDKAAFVAELLTAALVLRDMAPDVSLDAWREDCTRLGVLSPVLDEWLRGVQSIASRSERPIRVLRNASASDSLRIAAAVLALKEALNPAELLGISALIVSAYERRYWRREVEKALADRLVGAWRCAVRDQPFAFGAPRLNIPLILSACDDTLTSGLAKCARLLMVAMRSVSAGLPSEVAHAVARLAE